MADITLPRASPGSAGNRRPRAIRLPDVGNVPTVDPGVARDPGLSVSPAAFGAFEGQALVQLGGGVDQLIGGIDQLGKDIEREQAEQIAIRAALRRQQQATDLARVTADASAGLKEMEFQFEADSDFATIEERYNAGAAQLFGTLSQGLDEPVFNVFESEFRKTNQLIGFNVRRDARKKQIDAGNATLLRNEDTFADLLARSNAEEERDDIKRKYQLELEDAVSSGLITDEERVRREFSLLSKANDVEVRRLIIDDPEEAENRLLDPNEFPDLDEQRRVVLLDQAQTQAERLREERARGEEGEFTLAQIRTNAEISQARTTLTSLNLDRETLLLRSQSSDATGLDNPDFSPFIFNLVRMATTPKFGDDPEFPRFFQRYFGDEPPPIPEPGLAEPLAPPKRFPEAQRFIQNILDDAPTSPQVTPAVAPTVANESARPSPAPVFAGPAAVPRRGRTAVDAGSIPIEQMTLDQLGLLVAKEPNMADERRRQVEIRLQTLERGGTISQPDIAPEPGRPPAGQGGIELPPKNTPTPTPGNVNLGGSARSSAIDPRIPTMQNLMTFASLGELQQLSKEGTGDIKAIAEQTLQGRNAEEAGAFIAQLDPDMITPDTNKAFLRRVQEALKALGHNVTPNGRYSKGLKDIFLEAKRDA